jgi:hypothetical protein
METITLEEQRRLGLHTDNPRFVPAIARRAPAPTPPLNVNVAHTVDVAPSATQHIELRTSSVDRSLSFLIDISPLAAGFAVTVLGICVVGFGVPLLGLPSLIITFTVFAVVYTIAYLYRLSISAEGVSLFEAQEKWGLIRRHHDRMWDDYDRQAREARNGTTTTL